MYIEEELCPNMMELFGVEVNGSTVTAFDLSGRRWYQLGALFRALDVPQANGSLASNVGNQLYDSGEFGKYKDTWYATLRGGSLYADYLRQKQFLLSNSTDRDTARIRYLILTQWLSDVSRAQAEADDLEASCPECDGASTPQAASEDGLRNPGDAPVPSGTASPRPLALDMGIFDRLCDNLLSRMPFLAAGLSLPDDAPPERKLFAVMALAILHPNDRIGRMQADTTGIWNGEDSLGVFEAVQRSLILARTA